MKDHPFSVLLKDKHFIFLWGSQIFSQLTVNLVTFSVLSHIYNTTKSSIAVSLLWLVFSAPIFFFGPFSGGLVDRFNLKKTLIITNFLQAVTVLFFLLTGNQVFFMYILVFLYSSIDRLYVPAASASVPRLVDKDHLPTANGLLFLTQQASMLVGFGLGGMLVSLIGQQYTIILSALLLALASAMATGLPGKKLTQVKSGTFNSFTEFAHDIAEGYRLLNQNSQLKFAFSLFVFLQAYLTIVVIILPSYTFKTLGLNLNNASALIIVPGAVGALISSYFLPNFLKKKRKKSVVESSLLLAGISLLGFSLVDLLPHSSRVILSALGAFGTGWAVAASMIPANTFIQEQTPKVFGGRIYGLLGFFGTVATMIPLLLAASLTDIFGPEIILGSLAVLLLFGSLLVYKKGDYLLGGYS